MKRVVVVGAGQSAFGSFPEKTLKELFAAAARDAYLPARRAQVAGQLLRKSRWTQ
jgi:acetyl-CoA acetyltransferase